ncbi:glycosyltransferase family 1 protein [uncultured Clostridium sp.]|uniref:glycosyltransferase family 4 protein n=1 Tax=uncultured Clostridium sp. TaxID=59620 RepID=UPI0026239DDF|nr:glycosyltransferase family 1 protein [uncultured Clostridium sp.]
MIIFNALQTSLSGGIGRYSFELSKELYKQKIDMKIVIRKEDYKDFSFAKDEDLIIAEGITNSIQRNLYEQIKLPRMIYRKYPDAKIHYPDSMAPIFAKNYSIITVHDIAFRSLKKVFKLKTVLWKNFITKISLKKADKVIAITEFTKDEINKYYNLKDKSKIDVVYNGFNDFSKDNIEEKNIRDEIKNIKGEYIFTINTISPRKNVDGIIKAFNEIKDKTNFKLVIGGANGWLYNEVHELVDTLKIRDRVIFTGKVNDDELKFLYKNTSLFIYASFYEGFGLSPLEAMSYKKPCLVSNVTSMPEVVGKSAILIDPYNIKNMAEKMIETIDNRTIREEMSKLGSKRIEFFSWEKCAKDTVKTYTR